MTPIPLRRWFQFGLRTWFVVVAIVAWGLSTRPYWISITQTTELPPGTKVMPHPDPWPDDLESMNSPFVSHWLTSYVLQQGGTVTSATTILNPALKWPAGALALLIMFKIARQIWISRGTSAMGL